MKTIEEAAKKYSTGIFTDEFKSEQMVRIESFKAGVKFTQQWISVEKQEMPLCEKIILRDEFDDSSMGYYLWHKHRGFGFYSYSEPDIEFELNNITHWRPIEIE